MAALHAHGMVVPTFGRTRADVETLSYRWSQDLLAMGAMVDGQKAHLAIEVDQVLKFCSKCNPRVSGLAGRDIIIIVRG